jgi:hypothetical protein
VVVAPKPVTPPVAKPAAIPSTLAANEQARNILREYLKVGGNPFDSTRTKNLQQSLDKIHDKAVQAAGGDLPLLPIIVQNTEYASVRQMLVQQACSDKLFQQVPNDTILASACPTGGQQ